MNKFTALAFTALTLLSAHSIGQIKQDIEDREKAEQSITHSVIITQEDIKDEGSVLDKFYSVYTKTELNRLAKECMRIAIDNDSEEQKRICSSSYINREYNLQ